MSLKIYIHERAMTSVKMVSGEIDEFPITVDVNQGSTLSQYLFCLVIDVLTNSIQEDIPWCILFADDIILVDETRVGVNRKLKLWRDTLKSNG